MATVEAAHLQVQAARRPDLKGVASGVGRLTQAVFDQVPGAHSLSLWRELERLDGPTPISIPAAVRTEVLRQAACTLTEATLAASASHALVAPDLHKIRRVPGAIAPEERYQRANVGPRTDLRLGR